MAEQEQKIYLANGKTFGQYDQINLQVDIDKIFGYLFEQNPTMQIDLLSAFKTIEAATAETVGFNHFPRKGNKKGISLKLKVSKKKDDPTEFYGTLDTFVKDANYQKANAETQASSELPPPPSDGDMPF